jgi:S-adenosyl-L-methionine hydrolase (adenosine-forming)
MPRKLSQPIITLTSDFGLTDSYVAEMKAAVLRECPDARLIDVTHLVPRHDVLFGSIMVERAVSAFPAGTVHLAVVDPGVGSSRRLIVAKIKQQTIVCPDNGLITWAWRMHGAGDVFEITWRPRKCSQTFHGRDILAPIAGRVGSRLRLRGVVRRIDNPVILNLREGQIIHIDSFGNCVTNVRSAKPQAAITVRGRSVGSLRTAYSDVPIGKPLALIGSAGLLEIAVREGSARDKLKLKVGDEVVLR